jgi:hypothetical protein
MDKKQKPESKKIEAERLSKGRKTACEMINKSTAFIIVTVQGEKLTGGTTGKVKDLIKCFDAVEKMKFRFALESLGSIIKDLPTR